MSFRRFFIVFSSLVLASCCSCRTQIDPDELKSFVVGKTTMDDINAKLGIPNQTAVVDGVTRWTYVFQLDDSSWINGIPVAGAFVRIDRSTQTTTFTFGSDEKLEAYTQSDSINLATPPSEADAKP